MKASARIVLLALLAACASGSGSSPTPKAKVPVITAFVAHRDAAEQPTFLWLSGGADYANAEQAAGAALASVAPAYALRPEALRATALHNVQTSGDLTTVHFAQSVHGRPVFLAGASVLLGKDLRPLTFSGTLARSMDGSERGFALSPEQALAHVGVLSASESPSGTDTEYRHFSAKSLTRPARVREVFFDTGSSLEPAYRMEVFRAAGAVGAIDASPEAAAYVVSALDGRTLFHGSLVRNEQASYRVWADQATLLPMDGPQGNAFVPRPAGRPDGTRIEPVLPQLVTLDNYPFSKNDPWLSAGATITSGNNARSYADLEAPNGFSDATADLSGLNSAANVFDWSSDLAQSPSRSSTNIRAAIVHQFYIVNFMHDWFYDSGFDEKSGNPQKSNYGRGGAEGDAINIEAQDYSGRNNANAATPADGASPRIQMYIFSGRSAATFSVVTPSPIAGLKPVGLPSEFGSDSFDLSGAVTLGVDGTGADPNDACEPLRGNVTGEIVLVHRGTCSFVEKARNVQAAGARAMVLRNVATSNTPNAPPFMGGSGPDVTIPCVSLALSDGAALESAIGAGGATIAMTRALGVDVDGALDTAVVAHEWGHVLSNRLIGNGDGLNTNQAGGLGEGWSDFVAMLLVARPDDLSAPGGANWNGVYPMGSYAVSGSTADAYFGIRRVPYSVDFSKNGYTFKHIAEGTPLPDVPTSYGEDGSGNAEVHATGEVWATMLWECYVALLRDKRFTFTQAQERMKKYLVAGMKITPTSPTLLEARDALLAAAYAGDEQDYALFWGAFARRGAGVGAKGPGKNSTNNRTVTESFSAANAAEVVAVTFKDDVITCDRDGILDEGEVGSVEVTVRNSGIGVLKQPTIELVGPRDFSAVDAKPTALPELRPFQSAKASLALRTQKGQNTLAFSVVVRDATFEVPVNYPVTVKRNADEAPDSSATDAVDTVSTAWTVTKKDQTRRTQPWSIVTEGDARYWSVPNGIEPSDHKLTSPLFSVPGTSFGLSFRHRYGFESSAERMKDFDGGVVEVSLDGGKTWEDASTYGDVDYNVTLDNDAQGTNPLKGRRAYGNRSAGYPAWITSTLRLTIGTPSTMVQIRFRAGADDNAVDKSWDVDDIRLTDIGSTPFWSTVAHADACDANGPQVQAGANQSAYAGTKVVLSGTGVHPAGLPIQFRWVQESGPSAVLSGQETNALSFTAPTVDEAAPLVFALRGDDGTLVSPASRVTVTVQPNVFAATGGCSAAAGQGSLPSLPSLLGLLGLMLARHRSRPKTRAAHREAALRSQEVPPSLDA